MAFEKPVRITFLAARGDQATEKVRDDSAQEPFFFTQVRQAARAAHGRGWRRDRPLSGLVRRGNHRKQQRRSLRRMPST